jgi:hypothetical protein
MFCSVTFNTPAPQVQHSTFLFDKDTEFAVPDIPGENGAIAYIKK